MDHLSIDSLALSPLVDMLRCLECQAPLAVAEIAGDRGYPELGVDGWLECTACRERYPIIAGTPRMLDRTQSGQIASEYTEAAISLARQYEAAEPARDEETAVMRQTADSFTYEWRHFGDLRSEWRRNFLDYMQPHDAGFFRDLLVLDVGAGSGRHSAQAAALGAQVVAIDLGRSIDVARRNVPADVLTIQADAERLPLPHRTFDFVMSIGVLHHLPDPRRALRYLVHYAAPGGRVRIYLYWKPERRLHRVVLRLVTATRRVTVPMPHRLLHRLCYPLAAALWLTIVLPYRALRGKPRFARLAESLPLKTYADYPFTVLVNDQFDRFSAPLERRFTRVEVETMLVEAGLTDVTVRANSGWIGEGCIPDEGISDPPLVDDRISLVVTVRNDSAGLRDLIPALLAQTRLPDELVIVDGGSVDGTLEVLDEFDLGGIELRVVTKPGANIAAGRNAGVSLARHPRIAITDAGCRPEPQWLASLEERLCASDIVGGVFVADPSTIVEHVVAVTHYPDLDELDRPALWVRLAHVLFGRRYLPYRAGGRSMAFWRATWEAAGGFPEHQYAGEDQAFASAAASLGLRSGLAREAVVLWRPPGTWRANARMFYRYCRGDVRSKGRSRHVVRVAAWSFAPAGAVRGSWRTRMLIALGGIAYIALPMRRARLAGIAVRSWWRIPVAVALKDLSQIAGAAHGAVDAIRGVPQPTPHPPPPDLRSDYGR